MIDTNKTDRNSLNYSKAYALGVLAVTDAESLFSPARNPYLPGTCAAAFEYALGVQNAEDERDAKAEKVTVLTRHGGRRVDALTALLEHRCDYPLGRFEVRRVDGATGLEWAVVQLPPADAAQ